MRNEYIVYAIEASFGNEMVEEVYLVDEKGRFADPKQFASSYPFGGVVDGGPMVQSRLYGVQLAERLAEHIRRKNFHATIKIVRDIEEEAMGVGNDWARVMESYEPANNFVEALSRLDLARSILEGGQRVSLPEIVRDKSEAWCDAGTPPTPEESMFSTRDYIDRYFEKLHLVKRAARSTDSRGPFTDLYSSVGWSAGDLMVVASTGSVHLRFELNHVSPLSRWNWKLFSALGGKINPYRSTTS